MKTKNNCLFRNPTFSFFGAFGGILALIAWIGAIRNAWWCKAYGWLVFVIFTVQFGALIYGLFGPGRLAVPAEQMLRRLQAADTQPSKWTVPMLLAYLQQESSKAGWGDVDEITLRDTLRRFNWSVPG